MARSCLTAATTAFGLAVVTTRATAQRLDYVATLQSSTGDYVFTERTTSFALFNGLTLDAGRLRLGLTLPVLYQNSTAITYIGGTPVPTGGPDAPAVRERQKGTRIPMGPGGRGRGTTAGVAYAASSAAAEDSGVVAAPGDYEFHVGDPVAQADVELYRGVRAIRSFSMSVMAKAPVADVNAGIGTGQWDYGVGATVSAGAGRTFALGGTTYWVVGDMPELPLRNTLAYVASVGRLLGASSSWSLMGSVAGATAMIANTEAPFSVGASLGYLAADGQALSVGVSAGLSETSPGISSYVGWRVPIGRRHE